MKTLLSLIIVGGLVAVSATSAARAQSASLSQTWVSGTGSDANTCVRTAPCATFASAIAKTAIGGSIGCVDPGDFGPFTISKSISVICSNVLASITAPSGTAITINGGAADKVVISGIVINGLATGTYGIAIFKSGDVLIDDVGIRGEKIGVILQPTGPAVSFQINRSTIGSNNFGFYVTSASGVGLVAGEIRDSLLQTNANTGVYLTAAGLPGAGVTIDNSVLGSNLTAISVNGASLVNLRGTVVSNNGTAIQETGGAGVTSAGTNQISSNQAAGPTPTMVGQQ